MEARDVYEKEQKDVVASLDSIRTTIAGMSEKKHKMKNAESRDRKKLYKKQIKDSKKYLDTLFHSLRLELTEEVEAKLKMEGK